MKWTRCSVTLLLLAGCASLHPDRFYALEAVPSDAAISPPAVATAVILKVTIPSLVDRNELVLRSGSGVTVLEHERWAAPLADQVSLVLGQDLEQRRPDLIMTSRRASQAGGPTIAIYADIVDVSASRAGGVSMEVRWRIDINGSNQTLAGRDRFHQASAGSDYAQLVGAVSNCVAQLADRLLQKLPPPGSPSG